MKEFGQGLAKVTRALVPYLVGAALIALPYLLVTWFGPADLKSWRAAYIAGGFGGIALELLLTKGHLELPGYPTRRSRPRVKEIAPVGPTVDLGFMARVFAGALAAPVFLILVKVLSEESLSGVGNDNETIAWAVLIGAASPTVWTAAKALVESRITGRMTAILDGELEKMKKKIEEGDLTSQPNINAAASKDAAAALVPRIEAIQEISRSVAGPATLDD